MARFNGTPVGGTSGGSFGGVPIEDEDEAPKSRSIIDIVSGGISGIASDVRDGRAAIRKRERDEAIARANEAGAAMVADQAASGTYDELQQRAQQIAASKDAQDSVVQSGIDSARDLALSGTKGAANTFVKLPLAAVGVALDATGTRDIAERMGIRNREALQEVDAFGKDMDSLKSDSGKTRDAIFESTKGFTDTLITLGTRPAILADKIAESLVGTVAVGAAAGVAVRQFMPKLIAQAEAAGLAGAAAEAFIAAQATKVALGVAAVGEGAQAGLDVAGTAQADGRSIGQYGLPAAGAAVGTAAIGAASGGIARKLGIGDIEADIALRGTRGAAKTDPGFLPNRLVVEGFKEGVLEEMPQSTNEAAMENIAMGRPWDQGLGKAAATGLATGAGMGAGHAAVSRQDQDASGAAGGSADSGSGVAGSVDAADLLGAPEQLNRTDTAAPTETDKALYTPKSLTALDRVNEIDAKLQSMRQAAGGTADQTIAGQDGKPLTVPGEQPRFFTPEEAAQRDEMMAERNAITASWPKAAPGAATSFTTETGARLDGQYALMEAGDLTTSHDESLRPTVTYPKELQPRERDRHASEVQIQGIVGKLDPARLGESADVATGAPIVGADGLVESGNARTIALKRVYQANGMKAETYKQFIRDNAARFGIAPESIDAMQKPVLVRVRSTPVNRAEFARQANASTVARMSPSEQAKSDAAQIDSLDDLNPDEAGDFMSGSSTPFVRRFLAKLAGTEQAGLIDASGRLSQTGYTRIRNAVLAKAYGDSPVLLRMVESLDDNTRNVSKALLRVAPQVAKAREAMGEGALHNADLIPDLMAAVEELSDLKEKGVSIDQALAQAGMFGDKLSPEARQLLVLLSENARSPRRIADFIQAYLDALTAAGNPGQGSMFGDNAAPSKADLMTAARRATNGETATRSADAGNQEDAGKGGGKPGNAPGNQDGNGGNETASGSAQSEWVAFPADSGTLGIPRAEMPQVKGEHRGALIQFLDGLGITHKTVEMPASELKPTQAEFSTKKAEGWKQRRDGADRSVLASSDGYILDGHHQWIAALADGETEQVIQFSVPIKELLAATFRFPSVKQSEGAGNVVQLRTQARQDFKDALADLAQIASRHTRAAMLPENTPNLMPTLIKLSGAAIAEVGYQVADIIAHVKKALKSNEEFKKLWNKIDNTLYRKAALKAAEQASMARVDGLFSMAEERKGQVDLFSQPPAKKADAGDTVMMNGAPFDMKRDNWKWPKPGSFMPAAAVARAKELVEKFSKEKVDPIISEEDGLAAEKLLTPLIAAAAVASPKYNQAIIDMSKSLGLRFMIGPMKKMDRSIIKLVTDTERGPAGEFQTEEMRDILRSTIIIPTYADAQRVVDEIYSRFDVVKNRVKNRTNVEITAKDLKGKTGFLASGYGDVLINVRINGVQAEIQINIPEMIGAKQEEGHKLYEIERETPKGTELFNAVVAAQKDYYGEAYAANASRNSDSESRIGSASGGQNSNGTSVSPDALNTLPSGKTTASDPLSRSKNSVSGGNLSGTFIASTPSSQSIANPGAEVYTDGKEKSSGGENGQNGDTGSIGDEGKGAGTASATGRPGQTQGVRDGSRGPDQRPDSDAGGASGQPAGGKQGKKPAGKGRDPQSGGRDGDRDSAGGNAGLPAGRDIPAKTGRNYAFGDGDLTYAGSWQAKARQNVEAVELLKKLEKDGRQATREEQATLAKFIGWGSSEIANSIFGDKLDKQLAALANYEEAIERLGDKPYLTNASHYNYSAAFSLLKSKNENLNWYSAGNITHAMLDAAKPDASVKRWGDLRDRLKAAMTDEEWDAASRSTQYAHYTSKPVVKALLGAVSKMGFKGGTILEPGAGIGVFPGLMDSSMGTNSVYTGIEFDPITGGILKQLFPDERILVESFIDSKLPENFYDVAFGNPPFGAFKVLADPKYVKHAFSLHDYFFAKSLDSVKPGGLLVFVTSRYTMDKKGDKARAYMGERADLVGAIRLPQTAFQKNAGTEVVTDILFLRKKVPGQTFDQAQPWMGLGEVKTDKAPALINEYFAAHPEMVMGTHARAGKMYSKDEYTVLPNGGDIEAQIVAAVENLPADVFRRRPRICRGSRQGPRTGLRPEGQEGGQFLRFRFRRADAARGRRRYPGRREAPEECRGPQGLHHPARCG
jgi:predicted RNA methylase